MESFSSLAPLWDLSQAANFSQLPDDDFLALLQKQFPSSGQPGDFQASAFGNGVNPQSISQYSLPSLSPPSEDSSPSPPTAGSSNKESPEAMTLEDPSDNSLKRKASDDDMSEGPSQKSAHTNGKKDKVATSTTKRKSSGSANPNKDESRLIKRKEQNRAAQRAFRERKEKHVKDLEDKVSALEQKNQQAQTENENLRDLLSRLQSENMALKEASFTFSVPKQQPVASTSTAKSPSFAPNTSLFSTLPRITYSTPTTYTNPLDMTSLLSFDPNVLNLLDDSTPPQETATSEATRMDLGFNGSDDFLPKNYTTIASNPAFFSLVSNFEHLSPPAGSSSVSQSQSPTTSPSSANPFNFDLNSLTQWPTPSSAGGQEGGTLDDLFGASGFLNPQHSVDVSSFLSGGSPGSTVSPIIHQANKGSPGTSETSSPASHTSDPLFSGREGSSSESEAGHDDSQCPKTKEDLKMHIESTGPSTFVDSNINHHFLQQVACNTSDFPSSEKSSLPFLTSMDCDGRTTFPSVEKSDQNLPVLDVWRNITRNPEYKECDISTLCSEFASKARCDGSKVVLEPQGVSSLLETLKKR